MQHHLKVRKAVEGDIPALVDVELNRNSERYAERPKSVEDIKRTFTRRYRVASEWMWVVEVDGQVSGFITGQPTNEEPEDFTSWEESTDSGTLENTYVPGGENIYVVNLDVKRQATKIGGQYLLMAKLGGKAISQGKKLVMFESRMPQFRDWAQVYADKEGEDWQKYPKSKLDDLAQGYSQLRVEKNGHKIMYDRLLRFYDNSGFTFVKVVDQAFDDPESLNYGVLCVAENPIPSWLRNWAVNKTLGGLFSLLARSPRMLDAILG